MMLWVAFCAPLFQLPPIFELAHESPRFLCHIFEVFWQNADGNMAVNSSVGVP